MSNPLLTPRQMELALTTAYQFQTVAVLLAGPARKRKEVVMQTMTLPQWRGPFTPDPAAMRAFVVETAEAVLKLLKDGVPS